MILVTGASGTVGREVVSQLIVAGHRVRALARDPAKARAAIHRDVEVVPGDLAAPRTLDVASTSSQVPRVFVSERCALMRSQLGAVAKAGGALMLLVTGACGSDGSGAPGAESNVGVSNEAVTMTMLGADVSSVQRALELGAPCYNAAGSGRHNSTGRRPGAERARHRAPLLGLSGARSGLHGEAMTHRPDEAR